MLDMKLDSIVDYFLCDGQGLFYFRPLVTTTSCSTSLKITIVHIVIKLVSSSTLS